MSSFIDPDCVASMLQTFHASIPKTLKQSKSVKALPVLKLLIPDYGLETVTIAYRVLLENKLLDLRPNTNSTGAKFIPPISSLSTHHIHGLTSKGYKYLDEWQKPSVRASVREALNTGAALVSIASGIFSILRVV